MIRILKLFTLFLLFFFIVDAQAQNLTYKDVAPIINKNCAGCHNAGAAVFSLATYEDVKQYGGSVREAVETGYMPPWPPDESYKNFARERILNDNDKTNLISWIDNGMPAGDLSLAPKAPVYSKKQLNGKPDLILKLPKYTSTSTETDKYVCINVPVGLTKDRFIRAFEYIPGTPEIIHHAVMTIDTTGTATDDLSGDCYNFQGQIGIGDYAPGRGPTVLPGKAPSKFGFRLPANSVMSFQLHVPEGTAGLEDESELHIYFYPEEEKDIRPMYFETFLQNWEFFIPANEKVEVSTYFPANAQGKPVPLPVDLSLYAAWPHSHETCTSILNHAINEQGDIIPLIKIPEWEFHWQEEYTYRNMVKIPQGYTLFSSHVYDNTENNPHTPDHNKPVLPGLFTEDEMLFDSYVFTFYQEGDENIDIAGILANDPLFTSSTSDESDLTIFKLKTFPNPSIAETNITYSLLNTQYVQVSILNVLGQEVKRLSAKVEAPGTHTLTWDSKNQEKGLYFVKVQAGNKVMTSSVVLE
jgi:hypothetical protein